MFDTHTHLQVTIEYLRDGGHLQPLHVHTLLISTQHSPHISHAEVQQQLMQHVVQPVIPPHLLTENTQYFLNPSKRWGGEYRGLVGLWEDGTGI